MVTVSRGRVRYLAVLLCFCQIGARAVSNPPALSLKAFFRELVEHYDPNALPSMDDLMKVTDQTARMQPAEINNALPLIFAALRHKDTTVEGYAATALFSIGLRGDGPTLLEPGTKDIAAALDLPDSHLQAAAVQLLTMLKPGPQSEVVPLLLGFAHRTDRNQATQAAALSVLLKITPAPSGLSSALREFMSRPLDDQTKAVILNGIANSHSEDLAVESFLISALDDASEEVRFQAAQGLQRVPKDIAIRAKPSLQRVIERSAESENVKVAATDALKIAGQD